MRSLFFIAVLSSFGYLAYQESPSIAHWLDDTLLSRVIQPPIDLPGFTEGPLSDSPLVSEIQSGIEEGVQSAKQVMDGIANERVKVLQQELDTLRADYADLEQQLEQQSEQRLEQKIAETNLPQRGALVREQRREALAQLAERMEMQALGLTQ